MFVKANKNFVIHFIIIITFEFLNYNVNIFINLIVNDKNNRYMSRFSKENSKLLTRVYSARFLQHMKVVFFFE